MRKHLAIALFCLIAISCQGTTLCRLISTFTDPLKQLDSDGRGSLVSDSGSSDSIAAAVKPNDGNLDDIFHKLICNFEKLFSPLIKIGCEKSDVEDVSTIPALEPAGSTTSNSTDDESSTLTN